MPQPPFYVDQLQIEPGTSTYGTRVIDRDTTDGGLQFADPNATASLKDLLGLRNVTGVYIVGRAGDGAAYTTIQDALDAVPDASSALLPSIVWVMPGVYQENVVLQKDGVVLASPGGAKLLNSGAANTLTVSASLDATPKKITLRGLEIENNAAGGACIKVLGADTFASGTVTAASTSLTAGDTLTVNGDVLTGISGTRASGSDNFSVLGGTTDAIAAEIAAALNDPANSWADAIEASVAGSVITIQAKTAGSGGNSIALATSTAELTLSGATLTGGSAAGSEVTSEVLLIEDCTLIASGVGAYQLSAGTANDIWIHGGTWRGSSSTSLMLVENCSSLRVVGVEWTNKLRMSYDTGADEPTNSPDEYSFLNVGRALDTIATFTGGGALVFENNPSCGDLTLGGDRTFTATRCNLGDLSLDDTTAATLSGCKRGALTKAGGTPTLAESRVVGSEAFAASASESVSFDIDMPDADYTVVLENPGTTAVLGVSSKAATGFDIDASGAITGTVGYVIHRDI